MQDKFPERRASQEIQEMDIEKYSGQTLHSDGIKLYSQNVVLSEQLNNEIKATESHLSSAKIKNVDRYTLINAIDNTAFYREEDSERLVAVKPTEIGINMYQILQSSASTNELELEINIPSGGYMDLAYNSLGETDGSILVYNGDGEQIAAVNPESAKDKNGDEVSTVVEIDGNRVIQKIQVNSETQYPVTSGIALATGATSWTKYFNSTGWIARDGAWSLSLNHKTWVQNPTTAMVKETWRTVVEKHYQDTKWYNATGLWEQYDCHCLAARNKNPWNLEPWRPAVGGMQTIAKACNP